MTSCPTPFPFERAQSPGWATSTHAPSRSTARLDRAQADALADGAWTALLDGSPHLLPSGVPQIVGTAPGCDLRLDCRHVSRRHCSLTRRGREVWVDDLGSTNGVWLRGEPVRSGRVDHIGALHVGRQALVIARQVGQRVPDALSWQGMIGRDPATLRLWSRLGVAAASDAPVWLHGDTGAGKERAAHALHLASPHRSRGPWVAVNCAALPPELAEAELFGVTRGAFTGAHRTRPGAFEQADGGTLLLDEVGELPPTVQAKLLRVLEAGEVQPIGADRPIRVDVRVVAATWRDLEAAAAEGTFRHDLLHRLWVLKVVVPPLRDRPRDIAALLEALLLDAGAPHLWPDRAMMIAIEEFDWPGNVRQLRNHVRRAVTADSPLPLVPELATRFTMTRQLHADDVTKRVLRTTLQELGGNRKAAARVLGISRSTLYRWLERLS